MNGTQAVLKFLCAKALNLHAQNKISNGTLAQFTVQLSFFHVHFTFGIAEVN